MQKDNPGGEGKLERKEERNRNTSVMVRPQNCLLKSLAMLPLEGSGFSPRDSVDM